MSQWIGVEDVMAEMGMTKDQAWALIRRLRVPLIDAKLKRQARFTRADFEAARDRALAPLPPRTYTRKSRAAVAPAPAKGAASDADWDARLAKLRGR